MKVIDKGIRLFTLCTSVRWFGWGLGETFIPVFLLLFSGSFFETGLIASIYYAAFFLSVPIAGMLADRFRAKDIVLLGLVIYVFIGLSYFWAGVSGAIIFLIIARGLNGISYSLDQVGRESYFVRHSSSRDSSKIFGYFDRITNSWWIVSVLIGLVLIDYVEIHWLLLAIAPTSIISFFIVLGMKEKPRKKSKLKNPYSKMLGKIRNFNGRLRKLSIIVFFFGAMSTIVYYFAPAVAYANGASLTSSAVLILVYSIPALFGEILGKLADKIRYRGYYLCLGSLVLVLLILAFSPNYYLLLFSMFFAGVTFELSNLTNKGFMIRSSNIEEIGEIDGALAGIGSAGSIIGPILFGLLLSTFSPMNSYFIGAGFVFIMFGFVEILFYMNKRGLILEVVVIGILLVVGFFWFIGEWNSGEDKGKCVKANCCHARTCVWESEAPICDGISCTMSCEPETMDCGAGYCEVVDGECEVVWDE